VTDLERFFRRIVSNLAAIDAGRLREPVPLAEIPLSIVPYRTNRRALQVDTSEEYEMVLLRLCAGEGGYIQTDPEEVRQKFEDEARSPNPDLEIIHRFEDVLLTMQPERVDRVLRRVSDDLERAPVAAPSRPPLFDETEEIVEEEIIEVEEEIVEEDFAPETEVVGSQCVYCGGALPDRPVNFCPHCGQSQVAMVCPKCHADVQPGWRHCVNCGLALGGR
jgi:double zinc ribbon protein